MLISPNPFQICSRMLANTSAPKHFQIKHGLQFATDIIMYNLPCVTSKTLSRPRVMLFSQELGSTHRKSKICMLVVNRKGFCPSPEGLTNERACSTFQSIQVELQYFRGSFKFSESSSPPSLNMYIASLFFSLYFHLRATRITSKMFTV